MHCGELCRWENISGDKWLRGKLFGGNMSTWGKVYQGRYRSQATAGLLELYLPINICLLWCGCGIVLLSEH